MSAPEVNSFDLCFELAAVLAEVLLNTQAIGQAAHAGQADQLQTALREALQLQAEARAALMRFHCWVEAPGAA